MRINGIEIINFKINNGLYECDVALDGKYLGKYKQSSSYLDIYNFDKTKLEESKESFKKSDFYRISCFQTDEDINDFYTVDMFMNDICDLYLDESILINELKKKKVKLLIIGESLITNETVYVSLVNDNENQKKEAIEKIRKKLNNSATVRIYHSLRQFYFDNRYAE